MFRKYKKALFSSDKSCWYFQRNLNNSKLTTKYIGNLSFKIREEKVWEFFTKIGEIKRIITGINRIDFSPCGFCFIEFYNSRFSKFCVLNTNGLKLASRILRIDIDDGFKEGRQYGRGKKGGQLKEDLKQLQKLSRFIKRRG